MVQISNHARLETWVQLGKVISKDNQNDQKVLTFVKVFGVWGTQWSLTSTQLLQNIENSISDINIYAVRHRADWHNFTHIKVNGEVYKIESVSPDPQNSPTSYDLVTGKLVKELGK